MADPFDAGTVRRVASGRPPRSVVFGSLRLEDVEAAHSLSAREEWNQTLADWCRLLRFQPSGCFAARDDGRLVGTVAIISYGRELAWIGMMVVDPEYRGQGIGARLMRLALDHMRQLGGRTVKLDATPAGRPLYESLGFQPEAEVERWDGTAPSVARAATEPPVHRRARALLSALDRAAYGAERLRLLELLVTDGVGEPLIARSLGQSPGGFALARRGRSAAYIGPIVAGSTEVAERLLDGMLARFAGQSVCMDLHRDGYLRPATLSERGLALRRPLTRMRIGPPVEAAAPRSLCASAGPELG